MFHKILSSALCLFAIGTAYAQSDELEQRRGVVPSDVQEDLLSEILASKKASKWGKEVIKILRETTSYFDRVARETGTVSASASFLEKIKKVVQAPEDDVVSGPAIHASSSDNTNSTVDVKAKSVEGIALEKKALGPTSSVADTVHAIPADPVAPIIIIIQPPSAPILSLPVQRVVPPSRAVSTVRSVTPPSVPSRSRAMSRSMEQPQIVLETTEFVNILAKRQETIIRGPGSFSCLTSNPRPGSIDHTQFAPKLPIFNGTTLSIARSNVPINSLPTLRR